jgi:hypothetical protein
MMLRQVRLRSGSTELTCWVESRVRMGDVITLKNSDSPGVLWSVEWVGSQLRHPLSINRGWNNNI